MRTWKFVTRWTWKDCAPTEKAVLIRADSELDAMVLYCKLVWVQDIDYAEFTSLTITLEA